MAEPDPSAAPRHRRDTRLLVAVALAFFFIWGGIYLSQESGAPLGARLSSRLPLFVLWYLDVILIAATLFVIFRALIKLLLERRRGILGAKFKTSSSSRSSASPRFPSPCSSSQRRIFSSARSIAGFRPPSRRSSIARKRSGTSPIAGRPTPPPAKPGRFRSRSSARPPRTRPPCSPTTSSCADFPASNGTARALRCAFPLRASRFPETPAAVLAQARARSEARWIDFGRDGSRWFRAAAASPRGVVVAGLRVAASDAAAGDFVARAWSEYRKMEVQKSAIKATNILVFTLLTLALLFAAIWTGLTLARRITAPIARSRNRPGGSPRAT
jgi:two-component system nitrogen regulation sensor histidine kinase NtrY